MQRRQKEAAEAVEAQWAGGAGSFHADYDPEAMACQDYKKATRETEELYNAIVKNDVAHVRRSRIVRSEQKQKLSGSLSPNLLFLVGLPKDRGGSRRQLCVWVCLLMS